ncbi:hypothetical protein PAPYR_10736 [Paratrimastix pyriformis]|uniref:Uncharacterized protein n=1 Tax=Paratrimastix pyriformis TaxID=342808 RepID=A0ABQ8UCG2_9EUKA|nr:hypothetical protein PAPYR_10736 [Paratrimastix pyriformis]
MKCRLPRDQNIFGEFRQVHHSPHREETRPMWRLICALCYEIYRRSSSDQSEDADFLVLILCFLAADKPFRFVSHVHWHRPPPCKSDESIITGLEHSGHPVGVLTRLLRPVMDVLIFWWWISPRGSSTDPGHPAPGHRRFSDVHQHQQHPHLPMNEDHDDNDALDFAFIDLFGISSALPSPHLLKDRHNSTTSSLVPGPRRPICRLRLWPGPFLEDVCRQLCREPRVQILLATTEFFGFSVFSEWQSARLLI